VRPSLSAMAMRDANFCLFPWSSVLCTIWSLLSAIWFLVGYRVGGVSEIWTDEIPGIRSHAASAVMLIFSACVLEMGFLWTGLMFGQAANAPGLRSNLTNYRTLDSLLTLFEYLIKFITGMVIWQVGGPIHTDLWAHGGSRPVYLVRFAQWSVAVPLLVVICNRAFLAEFGLRVTLLRTLPAAVVTFFCVWLSWLMEVTTDHSVRWPTMFVSAVGLFLSQADQIQVALQCQHVSLYHMKASMVMYQVVTFAAYSGVFLAGRLGYFGLDVEQNIYAYCDSTVKVLQGALLALVRASEDSNTIHRWYGEAVAYRQDFDAVVKLAHVPIVTFRPDGEIIKANETATELLGPKDESQTLVGRNFVDLLSKDSRKVFDEAVQRMKQDNMSVGSGLLEMVFKSASRSELFLLVNLVPVEMQQDGKALVAIGQDLTELSELKSVEEKKNRLMSVVSHEIRSPLHGMIGLTTGMLNVVKTEALRRQLGMVRSCATRLLDLVTNVMDLSESERQKKSGSKSKLQQKVNFVAIAEETVVMSRMAVDKANKPLIKPGVELRNCVRDIGQVPIVLGNPYKCTQLIYNLLTNACKFTKQGSVSICAKHIKEDSILEISVVDTGCGISEQARERIFRPFEQEQSSFGDSRNFQGMGLGLAVCVEIVQMHGGTIRLESEVGKGSSFIISFACLDDEFCEEVQTVPSSIHDIPETLPGPEVKNAKAATPRRQRSLILSVDDCEVNQEIIRSCLGEDYEVVCCMDGPSALQWLEGNMANHSLLPDVILLDIQMPGMTGYDVCKKIRQHFEESTTALPIMMLSANSTKIAAIKSSEHGSTDFISKPFEKELLRKKIRESLSMKDVSGAPPAMPRQSTEDLSMDVLSAKANLLEAEKAETQVKLDLAERHAKNVELELLSLRRRLEQADAGLPRKERVVLSDADCSLDLSETEFLHGEIVQREMEIARLESQLGMCRASNQLIARRLHMQNHLNHMLHDTLMEGLEADESVDLATKKSC